jgi:hypothetical protein
LTDPQTEIPKAERRTYSFRYQTPQQKAHVEECQKNWGLNRNDTLMRMINEHQEQSTRSDAVLHCPYMSHIPAHHGKFFNCKKDSRVITKTIEECMDCLRGRSGIDRMEALITKRKQEIQDLRNQKQALLAEVHELDSSTKTELLKKIGELEDNLRITQQVLREKTDRLAYVENEIPQILEQRPAILKRTVEEKKTTEEYTSTQVKAEMRVCPDTGKMVSVDEVCRKTCTKFVECRYYMEIQQSLRKEDH